ncbi:phosphoserine phosphatase SerB [Micrococcus porci]|uniref:phosphoserine phosphatase SerB n=1 Tax=Micrococcus porci TaxID=2856555 RepID=UPI001CCD2C34|nr:phosphoserine phosphatase SerB [Micrococcus porci]UBH23886.1 phosphoserine phosphatase SerB [Micrococcus porci]
MTQARHLLYRAVPAGTDSPVAPAWAPLPADAEHLAADGLAGLRWEGSVPSAEEATALPEDWALASLPQSVAAAPTPLVVTDVDSTLIQQEVIELLAAHTGREAEVAAVTERAMRGELDFAQSLHARVEALAGLPASVVDDVVARVRPTDGAVELIAAVNAAGGRVCAVSGGFTQVLAPLAEAWGVHAYCANELEVRDGHLSGKVLGDVVDRAAKAAMLRAWAEDAGLSPEQAVGVGDGANDIDLLEVAGCGVALCAKPILREHADVVIDVPSFTPLRWLLGL